MNRQVIEQSDSNIIVILQIVYALVMLEIFALNRGYNMKELRLELIRIKILLMNCTNIKTIERYHKRQLEIEEELKRY